MAAGRPLIVCGDLNSVPGSDCIALFAAGAVTHTYPAPAAPPLHPAAAPAELPAPAGVESFAQPLALRPAYSPLPVLANAARVARGCAPAPTDFGSAAGKSYIPPRPLSPL